MTKLEQALRLANGGFHIHPLIPNTKKPATRWKDEATNDKSIISLWWEANPDYNIGIATEYSNLAVLDIDIGPGKQGEESLEQLRQMYGNEIFNTFVVKTRNGGYHFYFRNTAEIKNTASSILKDIDTRGIGGYVVGPGSIVDDKEYTIHHRVPLLDWPSVIKFQDKSKVVDFKNDTELPQGGRNNFLIMKAGSYRRLGENEDTIWAAINSINDRWTDKLDEKELCSILKSSMRFIPESLKAKDTNAVSVAHLMETCDTQIDWLVDRLIKKQSMNMMVSKSFAGKSYLCRDLLRACINGEEFLNRATKHVYPALWIGGDESRSDFVTSCETSGLNPNLILFSDYVPDNKIAWLKSQCKLHSPSIVVIDSYTSWFGGNFNSNDEVNPYMQGLKEISQEYNLAIVLIHHTSDSKSASKEYMGATTFKTQCDTFFVLSTDDDDNRFIETTKCRMGKSLPKTKLFFDEESVTFSIAAEGNPEVIEAKNKIKEMLNTEETFTRRDLNRKMSKKLRPFFNEAFDYLYTTNVILPGENKTVFLSRKTTTVTSPKAIPTIDRHLADNRPTNGRQIADRRPTEKNTLDLLSEEDRDFLESLQEVGKYLGETPAEASPLPSIDSNTKE